MVSQLVMPQGEVLQGTSNLTRLRSAQHLDLQAALVEMREATNLNQRDFATRWGEIKVSSGVWKSESGARR